MRISLSVFLVVALSACQPDGPKILEVSDSIGPAATTPVPPQATLIDEDEFLNLYYDGLLILSSDGPRLQSLGLESATGAAPDLSEGLVSAVDHRFLGKDKAMHPVQLLSKEETERAAREARERFADPLNADRLAKLTSGAASRALSEAVTLLTEPTLDQRPCDGDEGSGAGLDVTGLGGACATHSANGIYANFDFPLKAGVTCTKNQGNRGTCGAFAIAAVLETEVAHRLGRRVNVSEQDIYSHVKNDWWPTFYGDGIGPGSTYGKMADTGYVVPFESLWDYNSARFRYSNDAKTSYIDSCRGYAGQACSDTTHQARLLCAVHQDSLFCGFSSPVNATGQGFSFSDTTELWAGGGEGVANIRAALDARRAVALSINVPPTFDGPDANGFMTYVAEDGKSRGGHVVEVVGYVSNLTLAASLPTAPLGSGGGYLVIKNSWGHCYGDAGLVYAPYDWVKKHAWSAIVIGGLAAH